MTFVYVIVEKHENKKYKESSLNIKGIFTEDVVREHLRDDIDVINEHLCENVDERFMLVESSEGLAKYRARDNKYETLTRYYRTIGANRVSDGNLSFEL